MIASPDSGLDTSDSRRGFLSFLVVCPQTYVGGSVGATGKGAETSLDALPGTGIRRGRLSADSAALRSIDAIRAAVSRSWSPAVRSTHSPISVGDATPRQASISAAIARAFAYLLAGSRSRPRRTTRSSDAGRSGTIELGNGTSALKTFASTLASLLSLIHIFPADDEVAACVVRLAVYDDDGKPADLAAAMGEGYAALSGCLREGLAGSGQVITPVREAIYRSLKAEDDDVLLDEDLTIRRGESARFNVGFIGSTINAKARAYYVVKDELRTETAGPIVLRKGEVTRLVFASGLRTGCLLYTSRCV